MAEKIIQKYGLTYLATCLIVLAYVGIANRDFYTRGEGREAIVAQEILKSGNWILPQAYSNDIPSKPPFMHWLITALSLPQGEITEFTARLPSAIFYVLATILYFLFLRKHFNPKIALYTTIILGSTVEWYRSALGARVDMVFTALLLLGLLKLFDWSEDGLRKIPWQAILFFALATLSKGPVAILLPALIFTAYLLLNRHSALKIIQCLMIVFFPAVLLSLCWYLAAYIQGGDAFLHKFMNENIGRFLSNMDDEPHRHNVLYLWGTIPIGMLPWSFLLIPALFVLFVRRREISLEFKDYKNFKNFSLISIAVIIAFFSVPSSKRSVYLLPVYPFLAFYSAILLEKLENSSTRLFSLIGKTAQYSAMVFFGLLAFICIDYSALINYKVFSKPRYVFYLEEINEALNELNWIGITLVFILLAYCTFLIFRKNFSLIKLSFLFVLLMGSIHYTLIRPYSNSLSPKLFAIQIKEKFPQTNNYYSYVNEFYALSFYLQQRIYRLKNADTYQEGLVFLFKNELEELNKNYPEAKSIEMESKNNIEKPLKTLIAVKITPDT